MRASLPNDLAEFAGDPAIGVAVQLHDDTRTEVRVDNAGYLRDALEHRFATAPFQQRVVLDIQLLLRMAVAVVGAGGYLDAKGGIGRMDVAIPLAAPCERFIFGKDERIGGGRRNRLIEHAAQFIVGKGRRL